MVPQREAKDPGGLQYCLARIFRWGTVLAPPSLFGIAIPAYSLSEPQVSLCKASVSQPYSPPSTESPGETVEINEALGAETADVFVKAGFKDVHVVQDLNSRDRFVTAVKQ